MTIRKAYEILNGIGGLCVTQKEAKKASDIMNKHIQNVKRRDKGA